MRHMSAKDQSSASTAVTLPRREAICLILLILLTVGWFSGGREPIILLASSIFSLIMFAFWFLTRPKKTKLAPLQKILMIGLIGLVVTMVLSIIWSVNRYSSIMMSATFVSAAAAFIVARDVLAGKTGRQFWQALFVFSATIIATIGLYYFFAGNYDRVISLFYWPNPLAIYLGVATLIALLGYKESQNKLFFVAAVILLAAGILTFSRAAAISLALATVAIIVFNPDRKVWLRNVIVCLVLAILVAGGAALMRARVFNHGNIKLSERVSQTASSSNTSVSDRLNYWRGARDIYSEKFITGSGAGAFGSVYPRVQRQVVSATVDPHNFYLQVLSELGMIGFSFVLLIVIGVIRLVIRAIKDRQQVQLVYGFGLVALLLHLGVDMDFRFPTLVFLAAILLAVLSSSKQSSERTSKLALTLAYLVLLLGLVAAAVVNYQNYQVETTKEAIDASIAPVTAGTEMRDNYDVILSSPVKNPDYLADAGIYYYSLAANDKSGKTSYDRAEQLARAGIAAERTDARHYFLLANIFLARGQTDQATEYFKKTIELDPLNNPQYYTAMADLYLKQNKPSQAKSTIDSVLRLYTPTVIANRSAALQLKNRLAILYNLKAIILFQEGNKPSALEQVKKALELAPNYQDAKLLQEKIQTSQ